MAQLADAIELMRNHVRKEHVDIRMNNYVAKTMLDFIKGLKASQLKAPAGGEPAASLAAASQKRKRETDDTMPKAKKSPANAPNPSPSSKSQAREPVPSTPSTSRAHSRAVPSLVTAFNDSFPGPATDRLAVLRAAKEKAAAPALRPVPRGPTVMRGLYSPSLTPTSAKPNDFSLWNSDLRTRPNNPIEDLMANSMLSSNQQLIKSEDLNNPQNRGRDPHDLEREHEMANRGGGLIHGAPDSGHNGRDWLGR